LISNARFASDQHHRSGNDAAAENKIEFIEAGLPPLCARASDFSQPRRDRDAAALGE
jgi:hypothetical protein